MWNEICQQIFLQVIENFNKSNIKYFILRNFEGLPERNNAKDVDIVIEPGSLNIARNILRAVYKANGCEYYYEAEFQKLHCCHGMSIVYQMGIHIDLIEGYMAKGYEVFTFEELYQHTIDYKNMRVLRDDFDALLILTYKLFGYKKPELKNKYRERLYGICKEHKQLFLEELAQVTNKQFSANITDKILQQDFEYVLGQAELLTKYLKRYARKKRPIKTFVNNAEFIWGKLKRIVFCYRKYARVIGVVAPDGTGKSTFIENIEQQINLYYVNDKEDRRCDVRHFRPTILPNLGEVGEKAGIMEQDKDWNNPHRNNPVNPISSFFRMSYYMLDYIVGWQKIVRKNVQYDRFTIFDRYSYDFIVDPHRSKINLPKWMRSFLVGITPKPQLMFVLKTNPEEIYERKQELSLEEIKRQCREYEILANKDKRFVTIDASQKPEEMAKDAIEYILDKFTEK